MNAPALSLSMIVESPACTLADAPRFTLLGLCNLSS